jgi:steroid delta-isomerase-like uncharacterized protein
MSIEQNKSSVRRVFEEGWNEGRVEVVDECLAIDAVDRHEFTDDAPNAPAHLKSIIAMFRAALPDLHMAVEDLIGEGDRVAARVTMTGTHTGAPLFGVPAEGKAIRVEQFHIVQSDADGRGIQHWAAVGEDELFRQLQRVAV